jgi:hypothetical protein
LTNARGAMPSERLNIVENALALSYPRSIATVVTGVPSASRRIDSRRRACCFQRAKVMPVSRRKRRYSVR